MQQLCQHSQRHTIKQLWSGADTTPYMLLRGDAPTQSGIYAPHTRQQQQLWLLVVTLTKAHTTLVCSRSAHPFYTQKTLHTLHLAAEPRRVHQSPGMEGGAASHLHTSFTKYVESTALR
jgi:hypothetical protein